MTAPAPHILRDRTSSATKVVWTAFWPWETNWAGGKPGPQVISASTALWLHRLAFNVSVRVQNIGRVAVRLSLFLKWGIRADSVGVLVFPRSRWRASICPSRLHGRGAVAGRVADRHTHTLYVRPVDLGRRVTVVDTYPGTYSHSIGTSSRDSRLSSRLRSLFFRSSFLSFRLNSRL
jgi:hypothetical protein